jgi:phosphatidylinositol alpha-1,6-mannosyltransferase
VRGRGTTALDVRLLMFAQDFPPRVGGIQTYAYELARRFARACARFEVVAPRDEGCERLDDTLPFRVRRLPVRSDAMCVATPVLAPLLALGRFDAVLHGHWYTAAAGLWLRRLGLVRRVFVGAHGRELLLEEAADLPIVGAAFRRLRRSVLQAVDGLFPVSRHTAGILGELGVRSDRVHVVANGADPERLRPVDGRGFRERHGLGDDPVLFTLARLVPRKGIDTVLDALPAIAQAVPGVRYVIAGDGPDRPRLQALAARRGLAERVRFVGRVGEEELAPAHSAADVFVMPARSDPPDVEGFGLVFLEAGACGTPVVGARAGGVPDAIVDGETGLLVPPDDATALARACIGLLRDPDAAARMGERARARVVDACTWDHAAARMLAVMEASG